MTEAVLVAVIAAVGAVLAALVQKGRAENRSDHSMVVQGLNRIEGKIDRHVEDHAKGEF